MPAHEWLMWFNSRGDHPVAIDDDGDVNVKHSGREALFHFFGDGDEEERNAVKPILELEEELRIKDENMPKMHTVGDDDGC